MSNNGFLSKRVKVRNQSGITSDRYEFLGLDQAEPSLGDPTVGVSSVGAKPYTGDISNLYVLVSDNSGSGDRYWTEQSNIITGGVVSPGSITVRDDGAIIGNVNQITDINFVGNGASISSPASWVGAGNGSIDVRIEVGVSSAVGNYKNIQYKGTDGFLDGSDGFIFDPDTQRVGINTSEPSASLDIVGDVNVSGIITANDLQINNEFTANDLNVTGELNVSGLSSFANVSINGISTVGTADIDIANIRAISIGSSFGTFGQYLKTTGIGVTWETFPTLRTGLSTVATVGQTGFTTSYNVGFVDVYLNGIRLNESDYVATNGTDIILNDACSGGEVIDILSYSTVSTGSGGSGGSGGSTTINYYSYWQSNVSGINTSSNVGIGTTNPQYKLDVGGDINFTGTLYQNGSPFSGGGGGGGESYWSSTTAGIHTLSNVGIGTTNSRFALEVGSVGYADTALWVNGDARITGILTVGTSSIVLDGITNTLTVPNLVVTNSTIGISTSGSVIVPISETPPSSPVSGNLWYSNTLGKGFIYYTDEDSSQWVDFSPGLSGLNASGESYWSSTTAGIHTLSNVGIGTTNPTSKLTVSGGANISGTTTTNQLSVGTGSSIIHTNEYGVGIGTTADTSNLSIGGSPDKLLVYGRIRSFGPYSSGEGIINGISVGSDRNTIKGLFLYDDGTTPGGVETQGVKITAVDESLNLRAGVGANYNNVLINNNGVGIGTTNPTSALTVGAVGIASTSLTLTVNGAASINGANIISNTARQSIYIGKDSGKTLVSGGGNYNVALGTRALEECGSGDHDNIAIGYEALRYGGGDNNVVIGNNAVDSSSFSGSANVVIGYNAGTVMSSAYSNTLIGYESGDSITGGDNNIFIGRGSGASITTGNCNVIIGQYSGTGSVHNSEFAGYYEGSLNLATSNANIVISDGYGHVKMYINPEGNVGIATTNPQYKLDVGGDINFTGTLYQNGSPFSGGGGGGGESYWVLNASGIHTTSNVGVGVTNPVTPLQVESVYGVDTGSGSFSPTAGTPFVANSWTISSTNFKTAKYTLWFQHATGIQSQEILIMNDGTSAYYQEYGVMYSNTPIVSVGATVESGSVKLLWTPETGVSSGIVTYRFTRETML